MSRRDLNHLGSVRISLSNNPLLIQAEVGKVRRRCQTLPPSTFTYGCSTSAKDGGVSEAVTRWKFHKPSWAYSAPPGKDFVALNKGAILSGLTTAPEQQHFRATHDIRIKPRKPPSLIDKTFKPPEGMVFGISTRPSTPIYSLLENKYGEEWLEDQREVERCEREEAEKKRLRGKVYETRATLLRRYSEPVEPPPYWKMKRWRVIPPNMTTFPDEKSRTDAFNYHSSDAISRTGVHGHGIYQAAKS